MSRRSTSTSVDGPSSAVVGRSANDWKSCMPTNARAAARMRVEIERLLDPPDVRLAQTPSAAARSDTGSGAPPRRAARGSDAARRRPQDVDVGRQLVVDAGGAACRRGSDVPTSRCATCASAWTPASVRPDPYSSKSFRPVTVAHGAIDLALHGPRVLLDLPAAVARAGVFDRQLEAGHGDILAQWAMVMVIWHAESGASTFYRLKAR